MTTEVKLLIDRVDNDVVVVTNCSDGDIPLKTVLTSLHSETVRSVTPTFESNRDPAIEAVSLAIESCEIFRKAVDCIPRGFSAGIRLSGSGMDALMHRIAKKGENQQIFLAAESQAQQSVQPDRREDAAPG